MLLSCLPSVGFAEDDLYFGRSFAFCGDLDGDGCPEIATGSSLGESSAVVVLSGRTGSVVRRISGSDGFGYEVTAARDASGGYRLIVACPLGSSPRIEMSSLKSGEAPVRVPLGGGEFGGFVVPIADVDGNGCEDIAVRMKAAGGSYDHIVLSVETGETLFTVSGRGQPAWGGYFGPSMCSLGPRGGGEACFAIGYRGKVRLFDGAGKILQEIHGSQCSFGRSVCAVDGLGNAPTLVVGYGGESLVERADRGGLVAATTTEELYSRKKVGYSLCRV